jgi:hypothetical protein
MTSTPINMLYIMHGQPSDLRPVYSVVLAVFNNPAIVLIA